MGKRKTQEEFLRDCEKVHGVKYDYIKSQYKGSLEKVEILCKTHGPFKQSPNNHLKGQGCPKCHPNWGDVSQKFKNKANKVHNKKYDYSKIVYKNSQTKVDIICNIHGVFKQTPNSHLMGNGCPYCNNIQKRERGKNHPTGWKLNNWEKSSEISKNFESFKVYILELYNKNERFFKIGRTFRPIKQRFCSIPYKYKIIKIEEFDSAKEAYSREIELKKNNKHNSYTPINKFHGSTECFTTHKIFESMNKTKIRLTKIKELENALHPNNIPEGYVTEGWPIKENFRGPVLGERFTISNFSTSGVQEILSENTFRTYSSIYKWEIIE